MKNILLIICSAIITIITCLLCFIESPKLIKTADREQQKLIIPTEIKKSIKDIKCTDTEEVLLYSMSIVCNYLQFSEKNDISNGQANCVGYSQLFCIVVNEIASNNKINMIAKPVVGYVKLYEINLCDFLKIIVPDKWKNFVKDHDFAEVQYANHIVYYDPSLCDLSEFDFYKTVVK